VAAWFNIRASVLTGGAPGFFGRHFSITSLLQLAEPLHASGREWPDNATYNAGFFEKAMALCGSMPKPARSIEVDEQEVNRG
jgi:hypothetical protein